MSEDDLLHAIKRLQVRPQCCRLRCVCTEEAQQLPLPWSMSSWTAPAGRRAWWIVWRAASVSLASAGMQCMHAASVSLANEGMPCLTTWQGLGSGFGVVKIGSRQFVRSMPTELSTDSNTLIELAQVGGRAGGRVFRL